ncbi:MAG: VOC family protein [Comamonadaceae bacterium]|nr:MAG: VOC family protein [Comamonadaceae bacterium]
MLPVCVQTIFVRDLQAATAFYTGALGYEVKATYGPCIAQLRTGATTLILQQREAGDAVDGPGTVLCFQTEDIQAAMRGVRAAGGELLHDGPQRCPVGVFVSFRDPGGAVQQLLQFDAR